MREASEPSQRLTRRLRKELECAVEQTERGTWMTTSNLPHEIRLHTQARTEYVRVSAGMVIGAKATKALLKDVNQLNTDRAFSRRIVGDGKVLVVAEMPFASLRTGDLEELVSTVLCLARLDAPLLALHGGRSVTDPPASLVPDLDAPLENWQDVLRVSRTATHREFNAWLDDWTGINCWIDRDDESVIVGMETVGQGNEYPFSLVDLRESLESLQEQAADAEDDE